MTAKEAQSEAPSVDDELENILDRLAVRMYHEGQLDKPSLMGRQVAIVNINEAKDKINRLITKAKLDMLKTFIAYEENQPGYIDWDFLISQYDGLSNNLSKGKDND